ncbi:Hypothetical protein PFR_JS17-2_1962 [Propionibacterium freudenreichii]|nr:Hypothetical protein PFR_JS17-1_1963 [Propionibacterium freudenreichii]SCQ81048.1 Hypothetical protein PFR_JS17-2_1962 [Propionibacterium freudenreichii]
MTWAPLLHRDTRTRLNEGPLQKEGQCCPGTMVRKWLPRLNEGPLQKEGQ